MKNKQRSFYLLSIITLIIGLLLMNFLQGVYFVGLVILFILVTFQTPSPKEDKTGEINDANISMLKTIGLHAIMYLVGGYVALIIF